MNVSPPSSNLLTPSAPRAESANTKPPVKSQTLSGERYSEAQSLKQTVIDNHGFEAKMYTQNALTNNTKIINTPPLERGSLLDVRV